MNMSMLPKRKLGKESPIEISSVGLGTVPLSGFGPAVSYDDFEKVVVAAFDDGVRHFDCAPMYGLGKSEHFLGHALRTKGLRDQVLLSTKVGRILRPASKTPKVDTVYNIEWTDCLPFRDVYDYTHDGVMRSFEDSQHRLGVDHIDILFVHDVGRAWHGDKSEFYWDQLRQSGYRALDRLRAEGSVSAIGLGVNETDSVIGVAKEFRLDCSLIAGRYSLLNHDPLDQAFPELQRRGVSVIAGGVFNSGILAAGTRRDGGTYDYQAAPAEVVARVRRLEDVCDRFGVALAAAAVQFVSSHPAVASVLLGARTPDEVKQNMRAIGTSIPREFWSELKASGLIPQNAPTPGAAVHA